MIAPERKLFGTDGIRTRVGAFPLTPDATEALARAAADSFVAGRPNEAGDHPKVLIGRDTRESGKMLENALVAGFVSRGFDVLLAGIIPTPAVAMLTRESEALFGVVVSASHNPFEDNGIKFFGSEGYKLDDGTEAKIEQHFETEFTASHSKSEAPLESGRVISLEDASERYVRKVVADCDTTIASLKGLDLVLDAANGAAFKTSTAILESLGANVKTFHADPDGSNINRECGCTNPEIIEALVRETGAAVGISHDGDADRVVLCDETGTALDGDELMAIGAIDLLQRGSLAKNTLVATVMSNAGLDLLMKAHGGKIVRTNVGDRYVIEAMRKEGYNFGGEQSGHVIFGDLSTTGDGIVAAVQILSAMQRSGRPLSVMRRQLEKLPQAHRNVRVEKKTPLTELPAVADVIRQVEDSLSESGRILVRYSGTEPLLRILVEGRRQAEIDSYANRIAESVEAEIGAK